MRMSTKGGATPRDRRLDRGKVAIAAIAALFLFATNAQANVVEFKVRQDLSTSEEFDEAGRTLRWAAASRLFPNTPALT